MSEHEVTAERPDSLLHATGWDHVTLIGSNADDTVAFYRDVLGLPLVIRQPNLDREAVEHLFFDAGDGRLVTFFVDESRESVETQDPGIGAVHHLALGIAPEELPEVRDRLLDAGHEVSEYDRGAFHSLYTRDHNGLVIELAADKFEIPDDRKGEVLAHAQAARVAAGDEYVATEHLEAALEALGLPVERYDLPDAPTGRDF
ncbi:VOC family protein [Halorubrum sp. Boch-26]|uniref:VOC family protein n=1 Tax=Halorubrum sp. Boch-26 TaxID=2994426 RepID=UPI0024698459|nr:VOC family protein [Halorubrum sp. Boch-26]